MFNNEEKSQAEPAVSSPQNLATTDVNRRTPFNLYAHYFEDEGGWRYVGLWDNRKLFNEGQCEAHLHATADEACECFFNYLIDQQLVMLYPSRKTHPCLDCGEETNARATVVIASGDTTPEMNWYLCEKHHTKERLIELVRQAFFVDGQGKINILMYPVNRAWSLEEAEEKYDKQNS